ncbi:tetratricopeptide repeat protein [Nevskia ramosa]|uniref:tetratricopeptide repeat protein n=1 Tax=Nevskia ramosa TaxID=64002 RepID=UPI0003B37E01|nr:tetratricopeptide repeat protein [Nevskia ramosa]
MTITRFHVAVLLALGFSHPATAAVLTDDKPSTVGSTTETNGLERNGRFVVRTPSILRVDGERKLPPNVGAALAQYDRLLTLPADPATRAEALRRGADLRVQLADVDGLVNLPVLKKAISQYQTLLAEQPDYPLNDRVLYQLARAQQATGNVDLAIANLLQIGSRYPSSFRAPDGLFRAAELLFQRKRFGEAEGAYKQVLAAGPGNIYFEPAQFKYGWTLFRQAKHDEALTVFYAILDRELPPGELADPKAALAAVKPGKLDMATEVLRVTGLSLAALGGGRSLAASFDRAGAEPRFATLLYVSLADQLLAQQRYTDAADASLAFVERHPRHPLAPGFETRAMAAWEQGGFNELLVAGKARYVEHYLPGASYWQGVAPTPEVMAALKGNLAALGRHYHAVAQARPESEVAARQADFLKAADWYARSLQLFPQDPGAAELALLQADALYDGGSYEAAARRYEHAAYDYRSGGKVPATAPTTAYAAVQAWQRLAHEGAVEARPAALKESVRASLKLAEQFPAHPQWALTLTRAAGDLLSLNDPEAAFGVATRVLAANPPAAPELRREMLGVVADARYSQQNYAAAETAYAELIKLLPGDAAQRAPASERLARSVYEQAVVARTAGDLKTAARAFQRVGSVVPDAAIRPAADFDAASAYFELRDWANAEAALEGFRNRYPTHALVADAEKKLASAYDKDNKPGRAAGVYGQIAQRDSLPVDTRRDAQWLSAEGYRRAADAAAASKAYELYASTWPQPLDRAQQARHQLADIARTSNRDQARYLYWLQEIVKADGSGNGDAASPARLLAAEANLELGQAGAAKARLLRLSLPLQASLAQRRAAIESAVALLDRAAAYGYADVTTAATHELATVYRELGRAIVDSDRPASLSGEALEQYSLMLEEQANGFDEKAMKAYEANLAHLRQGVWNDWVRKSSVALSELAPARYGKNVRLEDRYESMH